MKLINEGQKENELIESLIQLIEPSKEEAKEIADKILLFGVKSFFANLESFAFSDKTREGLKALRNILAVHGGIKGDDHA